MTSILLVAVKIVVYAGATACAILLVGGAVKKVLSDPADECLDAGLRVAGTLAGQSGALLGLSKTSRFLSRD